MPPPYRLGPMNFSELAETRIRQIIHISEEFWDESYCSGQITLDPQNFGRKQQDKKRSVSQSDLVVGMSTRDFFFAWYKYF